MVKVSELFEIIYPKTMTLESQIIDEKGINFVSTKGSNNGVSAQIQETFEYIKYKKEAITVSLKGSVLSAFLQLEDFYCAHQIAILYSRVEMTNFEKLYYCMAIQHNKYRYNYGRQADNTLHSIKIPSLNEIPKWINNIDEQDIKKSISKILENLKKGFNLST